MRRCDWATGHPLNVTYHDREWGVPVHRDRKLFEMLILEGAQAGLSWLTILKKRAGYRKAFAGFDPGRVARFDKRKIERLMLDETIVRNRLKIGSAVKNARVFLKIREEQGSFNRFVWSFVDGRPIVGRWRTMSDMPIETAAAGALSKELRRRGMNFVGPTICYSFMQATGLVNDHLVGCYRFREVRAG